MTTGRINQVATLSGLFLAHASKLCSHQRNRFTIQTPASRWECLGICSSSRITQQAVVHRLTSFPRFPFEPSTALNQRNENKRAQPQWGAQPFSAGQNAALASRNRSTTKGAGSNRTSYL